MAHWRSDRRGTGRGAGGHGPVRRRVRLLLMSDALVAALTVLVAGLLQRRWFRTAALLCGGLALMRLSAIVAVPSVILAVPAPMRWRVAAYTLPVSFCWVSFRRPPMAIRSRRATTRPAPAGPANLRLRLRLAAADGRPTDAGRRYVRRETPSAPGACPCPDDGGPLARLPKSFSIQRSCSGHSGSSTAGRRPPGVGVRGGPVA